MASGRIIFLNGTSSSGKTSIARELQARLQELFMVLSLDDFFSMYPEKAIDPRTEAGAEAFARIVPRLVEGFHGAAVALAGAGNNLIIDHVLQEAEWREQCVELLAQYPVLFVGVKCPLPVLLQREQIRGDRDSGTAEYQVDRVHVDCVYDVEVDTSVLSTAECAEEILGVLNDPPQESGFMKMRHRQNQSHYPEKDDLK